MSELFIVAAIALAVGYAMGLFWRIGFDDQARNHRDRYRELSKQWEGLYRREKAMRSSQVKP